MNYICENKRFKTDTTKGFEHVKGIGHLGSVTDAPLFDDGEDSLYLEHVIEKETGKPSFWFMWYHQNGRSKLSASAVMDEEDLAKVINNIKKITF